MRKPRLFRWALWWGLGIMIVCLAAIVVDALVNGDSSAADEMSAPVMGAFYRMIYHFGIWPIVLYIGVIGPVFEELCFRLWGNGKRWTGYTSVVLMALWMTAYGWWAGASALAAGVAIMVVWRHDEKRRLFAMMLLSSVLFALVHIGNYEPGANVPMFVVAVLHKFGMGLAASYLVINYNLLWSIGLHILNNSVLALMFGLAVDKVADTVTTVEDEACRITLRPVLTKGADKDTYVQGWLDDSTYTDISTPGNIAQTLNSIAHMEGSTTQCDYTWTGYPKAEVKVEMLGGSRDYTRAVHLMEAQGWVAIDTVKRDDGSFTFKIRNTYDPLAGL